MKKALEVAKEVSRKYSQDVDDELFKTVVCESVSNEFDDEYFIQYRSNVLSINASNPRSAACAISQLKIRAVGGKIQDIIGNNKPTCPLRPLWIRCDQHVSLTENVGCYLPSFLLGKNRNIFEAFCCRVLELGFNALVLGSREGVFEKKSSVAFSELEVLYKLFDEYGIQLIIKPVTYLPPGDKEFYLSPLDPMFQSKVLQSLNDLKKAAPSLKVIFWESVYLSEDFHFHPSGREYTKHEKVCEELLLVESTLSGSMSLIYYLPTQNDEMAQKQAVWFTRLLNHAGPRTTVAFSAVSGKPEFDHHHSHPFWEELDEKGSLPSTPVMPIVNTGGVFQGEGYWPNLPFDIYEEYFSKTSTPSVAGIIHCVRNIPKKGSMADAILWVAGQSMWSRRNTGDLLKIWHRAYFGDNDFPYFHSLLKKAREVIKELSHFRVDSNKEFISGQLRCRVDTSLALIKEIECLTKGTPEFQGYSKGGVKESFQLFIKDARRIILDVAHRNDLSISQSVSSDFQGEGVWTKLSSGGVGEGALCASKVSVLDEPLVGEEGSSSHKVHWEANIEV